MPCDTKHVGLFGSIVNRAASLGTAGAIIVGGAAGGAAHYAYCHLGGNCSRPSTKASISVYNYILAESFLLSVTNCTSQTSIYQTMTVNNPVAPGPSADPRESQGCAECNAVITLLQQNRMKLYLDAVHYDSRLHGRQDDMSSDVTLNCSYACDSNVISDVSQASTTRVDFSCASAITISTEIKNHVSTAVQSAMKSVTDVTGDIGNMINQNSNCISTLLTNRIINTIENVNFAEILQRIQVAQSMTVSGTSISIRKIEQSVTVDTVAQLVENLNIFDTMISSEESAISDNLVTQNAAFADLVNNLTETTVGMARIYGSTIGKVLMLVGIAIFGMLFIYLLYVFVFGGTPASSFPVPYNVSV